MVISVRKLLRSLRHLMLFMLLVYILYRMFTVLEDWTMDKYKEPDGTAIKVTGILAGNEGKESPLERLLLFYELGE